MSFASQQGEQVEPNDLRPHLDDSGELDDPTDELVPEAREWLHSVRHLDEVALVHETVEHAAEEGSMWPLIVLMVHRHLPDDGMAFAAGAARMMALLDDAERGDGA